MICSFMESNADCQGFHRCTLIDCGLTAHRTLDAVNSVCGSSRLGYMRIGAVDIQTRTFAYTDTAYRQNWTKQFDR